jgi:hypothetical protein|tara:strand:+ start:402 stop:713 length:312 start_codon:yes stop_codon:yes gene_type:complete
MKKITLALIMILILFTSLVKNSTKEIEDEIFIVNENIRSLKTELGKEILEYDYLSSPEKLIQHQIQYFEDELIQINITKIKEISLKDTGLEVNDFKNKLQFNE